MSVAVKADDGVRSVDTGTDQLLVTVRDRVATITLNRPDARNALGDIISPALRRMIKQCGDDPEVGALVITGAGTAFCSGGDVKGMGDAHPTQEMSTLQKVDRLKERQRTLTGALMAVRKPTIACLPGAAAGAGLAIALACDIRIMAQSAFVATGYARIGLSGDYGIAWLLTRAIGSAKAREFMFSGDRIDAATCLALGLANRVVADGDVRAEAAELATRLAAGPAVALRLIKDNLDDAATIDFETAIDREAERLIQAQETQDHREAVRAFVEKRAPSFRGA